MLQPKHYCLLMSIVQNYFHYMPWKVTNTVHMEQGHYPITTHMSNLNYIIVISNIKMYCKKSLKIPVFPNWVKHMNKM